VKIHSTTVVVPLAALLLVGAAGAVLATSGTPTAPVSGGAPAAETASPAATTAPAPTTTASPSTGPATKADHEDTALTDALDKLVADGTITAGQKQAIVDAVTAERQARLDERQAQREALKAQHDQIRQFLADGQITRDELDQLPADSPIRQLTNLMDDGKITTDELRQLGRGLFFGGRGHGHASPGADHDDDGPDASPSPAPTTGG
jgi:polyhydroxyalkanoate synthesis regulator phasin